MYKKFLFLYNVFDCKSKNQNLIFSRFFYLLTKFGGFLRLEAFTKIEFNNLVADKICSDDKVLALEFLSENKKDVDNFMGDAGLTGNTVAKEIQFL